MSHLFDRMSGVLRLAASLIARHGTAQTDKTEEAINPGPTLQLTLDDAVRRAVDNNPDLAVVRLGVEVEAARVGESRSAFVPMFSTTFGRSSSATPPSNLFLGDQSVNVNDLFSSTGDSAAAALGLRAPGVCPGTRRGRRRTIRSRASIPACSLDSSSRSRSRCSRTASIDTARQQYIIAKRNQESSDLRFREAVVQTVAAVKQAYWNLKAALANVTVQQRSLELAQELARENTRPRRRRTKSAARFGAGRSGSGTAARKPDSRQNGGGRR